MPIVVSACVPILVGGIEHFIVLEGVEAMAEQQKVDRDLRRQLQDNESEMAFMKLTCATQHSVKEDASPGLLINPHTALGGPNTFPTWIHGSCLNCEGIERV